MVASGWYKYDPNGCVPRDGLVQVAYADSFIETLDASNVNWADRIVAYQIVSGYTALEVGKAKQVSGHSVKPDKPVRQHITDVAKTRVRYLDMLPEPILRDHGVILVTVEEWDAREVVEYFDYRRTAVIDGRYWSREDAPNLPADELRQQLAERDARIAELEKEVARLKETPAFDEGDKHIYYLQEPTWLQCAHLFIDGNWKDVKRNQAAALSFAPDPSDPRLGRNSGR